MGAALIGGVGWAAATRVDEVTLGEGRVIPAGKIKVVQSLEGGIISEILVREGQAVKTGDPLIAIDPTGFRASLAEQKEKLAGLEAMRARLRAEIAGTLPDFPEALAGSRPDLIANETRLYESRRAELASALDAFDQSATQRRQELAETRARIANLTEAAAMIERELGIIRPMVEKRVAPKIELVRLEQRLNETRGQREAATLSMPRIEAALSEAQLKRTEKQENFRGEAMSRLSAVEVDAAALAEALKADADKVKRARILAPVDGVIKTLAATTLGEVIRPGVSIAEIVPSEDSLLIEARVRPQDIAFLRPGLPATVELTAYDASIYGGLKGELDQIGADSITTEKGETFYLVRVRTRETHLVKNGKALPILPGMVAMAKIRTGSRTVLEYLSKPITRMASSALQER